MCIYLYFHALSCQPMQSSTPGSLPTAGPGPPQNTHSNLYGTVLCRPCPVTCIVYSAKTLCLPFIFFVPVNGFASNGQEMVYNWCQTCRKEIKEKYDPGSCNSSMKIVQTVNLGPLIAPGAPVVENILHNAKKMIKIFLPISPLSRLLSRGPESSPRVVG